MLTGLLIVPMLALGVSLVAPAIQSVSATDSDLQQGANAAQGSSTQTCLFTDSRKQIEDPDGNKIDNPKYCAAGVFTTIANTALFIIGAVSVLMLIYGGIRYTTSAGNEKNVTAAKSTITYAIVGLVVAVLAYAIVNFVISKLT